MNKYLLLLAGAGVLSFSACKEKGPSIDFGTSLKEDSTYIAPVPTAQAHYVLVEEFTGATCTNCPEARDMLHDISAANDERLIVMGIHPFGIGQAFPVHDSKYDFRTEKGTAIKNTYYGDLQGIPAAGFDRVKLGGVAALLTPKWASAIQDRLAVPSPVNLDIKSTYNETTHKADIEVKVAYTADIIGAHKISLVLIEDSLIDAQEFRGAEIQYDYVFMHVFRDYLSSINGEPFLDDVSSKQAGRVFIRRFNNVEIDPAYVAKHCKLIAFVHYDKNDNTEVIQAAEAELVQ